MLPIYYINLASRPDRRAFMDGQLAALGLVGTRIEAVTPADLSAEEVALHCDAHKPFYLRRKELACTRSHERIWETMLAAGDERALVLEDDAELSPRLPAFLAELALADYDLVRLEAPTRAIRVFPPALTTPSGIELRVFRSTTMGSSAYILKASGARKLLGHPGMRRRQTDLAIYNPFEEPGSLLTRVQTVPGLCKQLGKRRADKLSIGRSDIAPVDEPHLFATERPSLYRWFKLREALQTGWRNASDHFASKAKGLERLRIPFADQ